MNKEKILIGVSGIYQIKNIVNGKRYIGSSCDIANRFRLHRLQLEKGTHHSRHLQNAWNKYGSENFSFSVLLICLEEQLLNYEQMYLDRDNCDYNTSPTATSPAGVKRTAEFIENMRQRNLGKKYPPEINAKKASFTGKQHTDEYKEHMSQAMKDRATPEYRKGISERMKAYWKKVRSGEIQRAPVSDETRAKLSADRKARGVKPPNMNGVKFSEEHKQRISESLKRHYQGLVND